jgi:predicted dehydrogenase
LYFDALLGSHADAGQPVALCDVNTTRMAFYNDVWAAARPGAAPLPAYRPAQFSTMLDAERADAVVVTTPDSTHHVFIAEALASGRDVVTEKPLTTALHGCRVILDAAARSSSSLRVAFNYRYSPRNTKVKELLASGAIGQVTSVHFEWVLDTVHGADYFRRWHRDKATSGGLLVHKSSHHFDLVNWWLDDVPETVFAMGALRFYGARNAASRGLGQRPVRSHGASGMASDPFALDLAGDSRLARLYLEAEHEDGYQRDRHVFSDGITIEDNMAVLVGYAGGALLTYSLNAHAPWEGYRVAINGTEGRLELDVCERATARPADRVVDPAAGRTGGRSSAVRRTGTSLVLQRHWQAAERIDVVEGDGGHGGGDRLLLDDLFSGSHHGAGDSLGRQAGLLDGVRSVAVGIAANRAISSGQVVPLADLELPLRPVERSEART